MDPISHGRMAHRKFYCYRYQKGAARVHCFNQPGQPQRDAILLFVRSSDSSDRMVFQMVTRSKSNQ